MFILLLYIFVLLYFIYSQVIFYRFLHYLYYYILHNLYYYILYILKLSFIDFYIFSAKNPLILIE